MGTPARRSACERYAWAENSCQTLAGDGRLHRNLGELATSDLPRPADMLIVLMNLTSRA